VALPVSPIALAASNPTVIAEAPRPALAGAASKSRVDDIIDLVKSGVPDARIISSLAKENKPYTPSLADLTRLQGAGVSEAIIDAMENPAAASVAAPATTPSSKSASAVTPAAATPEVSGASTPYPPDLPDVPAVRKRNLAVKPFRYATVTNWVNYWFNSNMDIGEGIRSILDTKLAPSKSITLLRRTDLPDALGEQDLNASNRVKKGTGAKIGGITGADALLYGDIVIFGRDDVTKHKGLGAVIGWVNPTAGAAVMMNKEDKAVVGINLQLVDAQTLEVLETAEARGESSRKSKDYAGLLGIKTTAVAGGAGMTSSNFQQTIIGEATVNAVANIVQILEARLPNLAARPREIEGRVARLQGTAASYLNVGTDDGVLRGDRFEILQINEEIKDPVTGDVIGLDTVKVGEFVVDTVQAQTATGRYGGEPLSAAYLNTKGKGYAARLVVK